MKSENNSLISLYIKPVQKGDLEKSKYLNLPDLDFFLWCQQQYRVNRGLYNTIDHWFYDYGIVNIIHRRIYLLAFLDYVSKENSNPDHRHKYLKFGNGGLITKLHQFIKETETEKYII